jgi:hypothetical protein
MTSERPDGALSLEIFIGIFAFTVSILVGTGLFIGWLIWG